MVFLTEEPWLGQTASAFAVTDPPFLNSDSQVVAHTATNRARDVFK